MAPDLAKTLLSSEPLHYALEGHYSLSFVGIGTWPLVKVIADYAPSKIRFPAAGHCLVVALGLTVGHGVSPLSYNFWGNISGGNFHFSNYIKGERRAELDKIVARTGLRPDAAVQVTNGIFNPILGQRQMLRLFPDADSEKMDFILSERDGDLTSGAERNNTVYNQMVNETRERITPCFKVDYYQQIEVYTKKPNCTIQRRASGW